MTETEQGTRDALPLAQAAARLGISSDALRMRIKRGKAIGFKRGGRVFVELNERPSDGGRTSAPTSEQERTHQFEAEQVPDRGNSFRSQNEPAGRPEAGGGPAPGMPPEQALPVVVEFQKVELSRLLRDNARLNQRFDQLMDELRHLREMQQREQVLRQQDQALRRQIQDLLGRLTSGLPVSARLAAEAPAPEPPIAERPVSEPPAAEAPAPKPPVAEAAVPESGPAAAPIPGRPGHRAGPAPEPEPPPEPEPDRQPEPEPTPRAATVAEAASPPQPPYAYVEEASEAERGATAAEEEGVPPGEAPGSEGLGAPAAGTAELAALLKDIGASLRDLEPSAQPDDRAPPGSGEARAEPPSPTPPSPTPPSPMPPSPTPRGPAPLGPDLGPGPSEAAGAPRAPSEPTRAAGDDDAGLLEILGRMGPSAEDRRTAARIMKRLLRGRGAARRRDDEREPE